MKFRPIEKARTIIKDATGLDIMYAYDDLVFAEYGVFILQFDDQDPDRFLCYFNEECNENEMKNMIQNLKQTCLLNKLEIEMNGMFVFEQKGAEVEIQFSNRTLTSEKNKL